MKPPIPDDDSFLELTDLSASTPEERAAADALRDALDWHSTADDDAALLASLKAAHSPTPIDDAVHRAIVERALAAAAVTRSPFEGATPKRGMVIRVAFGASALAAAAAVAFSLRAPTASDDIEPFVARSAQALFTEPFTMGGTTARVDRIASARAAEFRENQFARWGVR